MHFNLLALKLRPYIYVTRFQGGCVSFIRLLPFCYKPKQKISNGEFLQSEELTRKITFSATYTIFANHKFAGISIFTFFRVFSTIFVELHSKNFSPPKNL